MASRSTEQIWLESLLRACDSLLSNDPARAGAARFGAAAALAAAGPRALSSFEQRVRGRLVGLTPSLLAHAATEELGDVVVKLATWDRSGYVRQEALRILARWGDSGLPFILLRLNDWVPQVHGCARDLLLARLSPESAPALLQGLWLIDQLLVYRRRDHQALHGAITRFLLTPPCRPALLAALSEDNREVARPAFALAAEAEDPELVRQAVELGLQHQDLMVRVRAARVARSRLYGKALRETLGQARGDRAAPVRKEALLGFLSEHPELRASLWDPCASIREMVRFYLRKYANLDLAAAYRESLPRARGAELAVALLGLGETGGRRDAALVAPYTGPGEVRVRKAALCALGRLDAQGHAALLLAAASDPHPGVSRAARQALSGSGTG